MKKLKIALAVLLTVSALSAVTACDDTDTYKKNGNITEVDFHDGTDAITTAVSESEDHNTEPEQESKTEAPSNDKYDKLYPLT